MNPIRRHGLLSLLTIGLYTPLAVADANYQQLAQERAERAASQAEEAAAAPANPKASSPTNREVRLPQEPAVAKAVPSQTQRATGGGPLEDQPLVIDISTLFDEDGLGTLSVQWQGQEPSGNWVNLDGAVTQSFTPRQRHVGQPLRVVIQYVDGQGTLEVIETAPTGPVQNVNDLPQGMPRISGTLIEDSTLKVETAGISDEDGLGRFQYQWERSADGLKWEAVTSSANTPALLRLGQSEVGYAYRARISYVDSFGTRENLLTAATDTVQNLDDPVEGQVILEGIARKGEQLLVLTDTLRDEDGIANIRTTWEASDNGRDWRIISESSDSVLQLTQSEVNKLVRARAVVVDNFGAETTLYSQPTELVQNVNSQPRGVIRILATGE